MAILRRPTRIITNICPKRLFKAFFDSGEEYSKKLIGISNMY